MRPDSIELVSIAVDIHGEKHLKKIHIRHEIQKIIDDLIKEYDLDGTAIEYGLRLTHARNKKIATRYVTDTNKSTLIQDGCELKLVEAPKLHLEYIFKKIFSKDQRESGYDLLNHQLHDDYLLQIIHEVGWDTDICNKVIADDNLKDNEIMVTFNIIFKLLRRKYITNVPYEIVKIVIDKLRNFKKPIFIYSAILLLRELLFTRHFDLIISKISIANDLIPILWYSELPKLQCTTLSCINVIVKLCDRDERQSIIRIMNVKISRKTISETILNSETKLSPEMEKELHMYQTYILSLNLEKTTHKIKLSDDNFDLKFLQEDMSHYMNQNLYSRTISFYESLKTAEKPKQDSNDGANTSKFFLGEDISDSLALLFDDDYTSYYHDIDASLKWVSHANKDTYNDFLEESSYILQKTVTNENEITELTLECLVYFKQKYPQSYHIAYLEQNEYEPGFFTTSERICQIMCDQLRIGQDPLKNSTLYCPLVFSSLEQPFLSEIFCRLMWLYVKTRIEMSAKTGDDQLKVLAVLHTQTKLVFNTKPKTYNDFMAALKCFPYSFISILWKNEQRVKWKRMLENNPNIIELSEAIEPQITGLIKENRYKHLIKGNKFHLFEREKKSKSQWIYFRLLQNQQQLVYSEWNPQYEICSLEVTTIHISDIKYLVTGNACVHVKDHRVKKPDFAFSILTEDNSYDFEAINESVYNTWIDGLSALIGKEMGSNFYQKDKSKLLELELMLRLLDTENIPLPMTPPPIPPPPSNYDFYYDDNESTC